MRLKILCIMLIFLSPGCETDINLFTEKANQAIVYGVICPTDSIHFIRIQKTFQTVNNNDFTVDQSDLYFDSLHVKILGISNEEELWSKTLVKTVSYKDSGLFPYENHLLYVLDSIIPRYYNTENNDITVIDKLRIEIEFVELDIRTSAESIYLGPTKIYLSTSGSKIISCYGESISRIHLDFDSNRAYSSFSDSYIELGMKFYYSEFESGNSRHDSIITISKDADFSSGGYQLNPERLFNRILHGIKPNKNVTSRRLDSIHFFSNIPDNVFAHYWNTRINREDHDYPPYSNFDNENVFGMFFCITKGYETGFALDQRSMDSLCNGEKWKHLKFKHW